MRRRRSEDVPSRAGCGLMPEAGVAMETTLHVMERTRTTPRVAVGGGYTGPLSWGRAEATVHPDARVRRMAPRSIPQTHRPTAMLLRHRIACRALLPLLAATPALGAGLDPVALDRGSDIAYRRTLEPAATDRRLNADRAMAARARRVLSQLVVAAPAIEPASKSHAWAVNVVTNAAPDARAFPGGRLIINDGLFSQTGFTDEEAAAILAHALAHSLLGHDTARIASSALSRPASADPNRQVLDVAQATLEALGAPRYSRAEIEAADRASVEMLARAVYDPRAAGSAWRRLARADKGIRERVTIDDERLAALDAAIRAAVPLYEESRAKAAAAQARVREPAITGRPKAPPPPVR